MNRGRLIRAAERLTGQPWSLRAGNGSPIDVFAAKLNVSPGEVRRWHRRSQVTPSSAVARIEALLIKQTEKDQTMEDLRSPIEPRAETAPERRIDNGSRVAVLDEVENDPVADAIRLWQIDQALTHLTRHHGVLGLGANAVQEALREERNQIIERLKLLGAQFA